MIPDAERLGAFLCDYCEIESQKDHDEPATDIHLDCMVRDLILEGLVSRISNWDSDELRELMRQHDWDVREDVHFRGPNLSGR